MIETFVVLIITAGALHQSVRHLDVLFDSSVICTLHMYEYEPRGWRFINLAIATFAGSELIHVGNKRALQFDPTKDFGGF